MSIKDPIADLFTRIRNALKSKHSYVEIPFSNTNMHILEILKNSGYIDNFSLLNHDLVKRILRVKLKYDKNGIPFITSIKRISKSSKRIYLSKSKIPKVRNGFGISIISTPKGILTGKDARLKNVGGEYLGEVF